MRAVTTEDGDLTPVGALGFETCKLACEGGRSHSVIHIAQQQKSFAGQQAMALSEIWNKRNSILCGQVGTYIVLLMVARLQCLHVLYIQLVSPQQQQQQQQQDCNSFTLFINAVYNV